MILEGMVLTIEVALLSLIIAVILGLVGAMAKLPNPGLPVAAQMFTPP